MTWIERNAWLPERWCNCPSCVSYDRNQWRLQRAVHEVVLDVNVPKQKP